MTSIAILTISIASLCFLLVDSADVRDSSGFQDPSGSGLPPMPKHCQRLLDLPGSPVAASPQRRLLVLPATSTYQPGLPVTVIVAGMDEFQGLAVQARTVIKDKTRSDVGPHSHLAPIGHWTQETFPGSRSVSCEGSPADTAIQDGGTQNSVSLQWIAPESSRDIYFFAQALMATGGGQPPVWIQAYSDPLHPHVPFRADPPVHMGKNGVSSQRYHDNVFESQGRYKRDAEGEGGGEGVVEAMTAFSSEQTDTEGIWDNVTTVNTPVNGTGATPPDTSTRDTESLVMLLTVLACYVGMYTGFSLLLI